MDRDLSALLGEEYKQHVIKVRWCMVERVGGL
jgi:hypothetical protein